MSKLGELGSRLYRGDVSIDFVGRRKTWYMLSLGFLIIAALGLGVRHLNYGIEFRGGVEFDVQIASAAANLDDVRDAVVGTEIEPAANPIVVTSNDALRVQTEPLSDDQITVVTDAIKSVGATEVSSTSIGPTWGQSVANRALTGLVVFLILVVLVIWAYFREWRMSVAGMVALAHDLVITVGIYALTGFEVTPSTVTGFLTILGYSLYDTVVVFDKVRENNRGILTSTRRTYAEGANLAVNQTLVRSINTSVAALLPVGAILYVGIVQLGSGPLKDLALALFVGMAVGTYSSIFVATPLLAQLKMREPSMIEQAKRVASRRAQTAKVAAEANLPVELTKSPSAGRAASAGPSPERARPTSAAAAKRAQPQRQPRSQRGKKS